MSGETRTPTITLALKMTITVTTGHLLVPPATQTFTHDLDGNQTSDGVWTNTWNAANRLVTTETLPGVPVAARRREVWSHLPDGRWSQRISTTGKCLWPASDGTTTYPTTL